jgi:hypothetical protein
LTIRITICGMLFCVLTPFAFAQSPSRALSVIGGVYPIRGNFGRTWVPLSSVQIRYSPSLKKRLRVDWSVEYFYLKHAWPTGVSHTFFRAGMRQDVAIYPTAVIFNFIHLGLGLYYTHRDEVVTRDGTLVFHRSGPMSFVRFFYEAALMYTVDISKNLAVPVGLSFRRQDYDPNTTPIALCAGIAVRF